MSEGIRDLEQCLFPNQFIAFPYFTVGLAAQVHPSRACCLPRHIRAHPFSCACRAACPWGRGCVCELLMKSVKGSGASSLFSTPASLLTWCSPTGSNVLPAMLERGQSFMQCRLAADKFFLYLESVFILLSRLKFVFSRYEIPNLWYFCRSSLKNTFALFPVPVISEEKVFIHIISPVCNVEFFSSAIKIFSDL